MSDPPRVLFYGSPDFAVPTLRALIDSPYRPVAVVTQPDARAGARAVAAAAANQGTCG